MKIENLVHLASAGFTALLFTATANATPLLNSAQNFTVPGSTAVTSARSIKSKFLGVRWLSRFVALFFLLLVAAPAQAANYVFSADPTQLPPGTTIVSPGNYSCGVLTLGAGDTISVGGTKPATVTFSGAFTTGANNLINAGGLASDLTLVTVGVLTLGADTLVNANVIGTAAVNLGIGSTLSGNLTTASPTGVVTLGAGSRVGGYILTDAGAVTVGIAGSVGGGITTTAGVVTLGANVKIDGDIRTIAGAITIGDGSSTCGSVITTGAGVITLPTNVKIGGNISSVSGAITVGAGSTVGGNVIPTGAGVVTLTGVQIGGNVTTGDGAITVTDSRVGGSVAASGAGVVTIVNSTVNDTTLVVPPSPACFTKAPATPSPTSITNTYNGSTLTLNWPSGQGWRLQAQTNGLASGLTTNWANVSGATPPYVPSPNAANGAVFYRLVWP